MADARNFCVKVEAPHELSQLTGTRFSFSALTCSGGNCVEFRLADIKRVIGSDLDAGKAQRQARRNGGS